MDGPLFENYMEALYGDEVAALWNLIFPQYTVPTPHFKQLLNRTNARHVVACDSSAVIGAGLSFVTESQGFIAAIFVANSRRCQGIGSEILEAVKVKLHECTSVSIGSIFPRFWPGLPTDVEAISKRFFMERGFSPTESQIAKDLTIDLDDYEVKGSMLADAEREGISFSPWHRKDYEECMKKQRANFDNAGWVAAYERLASSNLYRQVMVAKDKHGDQVAWTLMVEPNLPVWSDLAFPQLIGEKTALIACVGTDGKSRNRGIGRALVVAALQDLKARGMKHVFVDWVTLPHFYEAIGFRVWRTYRSYVLEDKPKSSLA